MDVFHQKAQFTSVNEHFETIFNAGMAKRSNRQGLKTTRAKVSIQLTDKVNTTIYYYGNVKA